MSDPFADLPKNHFGAILADPPWKFITRGMARCTGKLGGGDRSAPYPTMSTSDIAALPVSSLAAQNSVLFLWGCWPNLMDALAVIDGWGFAYKTCAFSWMKADPYRLFADEATPAMGMGYWTRANTEPCLLATCGNPKRLRADIRQGIIASAREHSRKPDCVHERIERLVAGPYLELFARQQRPGWIVWGNETDKFSGAA